MSKGVPFETAFAMGDAELLAFVVTMGEVSGAEWDWRALRWIEKK